MTERQLIEIVAGVWWDEYPISAGRTLYTVWGHRFVGGPLLRDRVEVREVLGEFYSYHDARDCERSAYHHDFTYIEQVKLCLLTDRCTMTQHDRDVYIRDAVRSCPR